MPTRPSRPKARQRKKKKAALSQTEIERHVRENEFDHLTQEQNGKLFGIGKASMRALARMPGFPLVAKKINPAHLKLWLWEHHREISEQKLVPE